MRLIYRNYGEKGSGGGTGHKGGDGRQVIVELITTVYYTVNSYDSVSWQ
jgi:hypothetical protein